MRAYLFLYAALTGVLATAYFTKVQTKSSKPTMQKSAKLAKGHSYTTTIDQASKSPMEWLLASSCGELVKSATKTSLDQLEKILPNERFWNFIRTNSAPSDDIMLIDADKHTWLMLVNQAVALKEAGSKLKVHAVAHDAETCDKVVAMGVPCYYDHQWYKELAHTYVAWAGAAYKLNMVMLVRMMTTTIAVCEGRSVFLSDSDVLFYRDPMDYVFKDVNIMVTATEIDFERWSGPFFSDQPTQGQTLNNGVVFYRNNDLTKAFLLTLAVHCITGLITNHGDPDSGFLQTTFNMDLKSANLRVHPSRDVSSNITYRLTYAAGYSNPAGECYDCYYGKVPWRSNVVATSETSELRVGIFPTKRCLSSSFVSQKGVELLLASAKALRMHDNTRWGWNELDGESRMMCVHANGHAKADENSSKMSGKEEWFRNITAWFLDK